MASTVLTLENTGASLFKYLSDFIRNLATILQNTLEEDFDLKLNGSYIKMDILWTRFSTSYNEHYNWLLPTIKTNLDQTQFSTAFCSLVVPVILVMFVMKCVRKMCDCGSNEDGFDDVDGRQATVPYKLEGQRWLKQAQYDLNAVAYDVNQTQPAFEWACFKCQQVRRKNTTTKCYN